MKVVMEIFPSGEGNNTAQALLTTSPQLSTVFFTITERILVC